MIAVLDPSPLRLSRLYDREKPPFRVTRETLFAVGFVAAVQFGIGFSIAHTYFAPPAEERPPEANAVAATIQRIIRPQLLTPPTTAKAPTTPKPLTTAPTIHEPPVILAAADDPVPVTPHSDAAVVDSTASPFVQPDRGPVVQPVPPKEPPLISNPTWLSKPTSNQVGRLYPARAAERGVTGKATLLCEVQTSGAVGACTVTDETPKGYRFGDAALSMTRYFKLSPQTVDGVSVAGSKVRIPIVFNLG